MRATPTLYSIHAPYTLRYAPYTLGNKSFFTVPVGSQLSSSVRALNPQPRNLNPAPCNLNRVPISVSLQPYMGTSLIRKNPLR